MSQLTLYLLGSPRVELDSRPVSIDRRKALGLLAYLAVTGQSHSRDTLAGLLWPDYDRFRARGALRRVLLTLKTACQGDWWKVDRDTIGLGDGAALWVDVRQFRSLATEHVRHDHPESEMCPRCLTALKQAVDLYRDDFLAGFSLPDSASYDEWQLFEADTLRRELALALQRLIQGYWVQGELEQTITYARRWVALDSLHEPAQRVLIALYAQSGQRIAALRQYSQCVQLLETELGVAPEAATTELFQAIKDNRLRNVSGILQTSLATAGVAARLRYEGAVDSVAASADMTGTRASKAPAVGLPTRITRNRFIGREHELQRIQGVWTQVISGEGHILLVTGEPGIGKSRLAHEIAAWVRTSGGCALLAECYAKGEAPYGAVAQLIREVLGAPASAVPKFELPAFVLADLIRLAPDLQARFQHIPANPALNPETEAQRLRESFVELCTALSAETPALLIVDDMQWADSGVLSVLRHLARRLRRLRLLVVLAYREFESYAAPELNDWLLEMRREHMTDVLRLAPLTMPETQDLLTGLLSGLRNISPDLLRRVYADTEGNPFFIEQVCEALLEGGKLQFVGGQWAVSDAEGVVLPRTVREIILSRLVKLPRHVQETLLLAAVLGREFDVEILSEASTLDNAILAEALEHAEQAQLIEERRRGGQMVLRFRHVLIPFALRESMNGLRLRRLHSQAAQAIEAGRPDDVEALAYHFTMAGKRGRAIAYCQQAAQRAQAVHAYEAALRHLRTALDLMMAGGALPRVHLEVVEQLADVNRRLHRGAEAVSLYETALAIWAGLTDGDPNEALRLHCKIVQAVGEARFRVSADEFEDLLQSGAVSQAWLDADLRQRENKVSGFDRLHTLVTLSKAAWQAQALPKWDAAEGYARSGVSLAEQLDDPGLLSTALDALMCVYYGRGRLQELVRAAEQRLALRGDERLSSRQEHVVILNESSHALAAVGQYAPAITRCEEAERLSSEIYAVDEQMAAVDALALCWFHLDRWDEVLQTDARRQALERRHTREQLGPACFEMALTAAVHALRGELEPARRLQEASYSRMAAVSGPPPRWLRTQFY